MQGGERVTWDSKSILLEGLEHAHLPMHYLDLFIFHTHVLYWHWKQLQLQEKLCNLRWRIESARARRSSRDRHTDEMSIIPTYIVRRNIITPEAIWEERSIREDSWLHSAGWRLRVIKRMRRRRRSVTKSKNNLCKLAVYCVSKLGWQFGLVFF